ncbi:ATP-grasp ribosomal peptide maturase [Streptomyces sp. NPDC005407]|uniref:ATP-grasp ribosomal peptide maturase n=1 Tax=Streptomyces sp. NPDC005407 TaxID=3155340 RepID=UPI0033BF974E
MPAAGPPVLVVTRLDDATADTVISELNRRKLPVARLDPGNFPDTVTVTTAFDSFGPSGLLRTATRTVDLGRVRSVYWRRPNLYAAPEGIAGQDARWCTEEARYGLGGVLGALPGAHYVNHPWRNRDAEYKPAQLATAARYGMTVPPTAITNDPYQARQFADEHGPVIYKPLRETDYLDERGRALTVWIDDVTADRIGDGVAHTAHLFQQRVNKIADIRMTAVGDRLFPVRIDGSPGVDWRRHYESLTYTVIDAPPDVAKGVRAYLDAFGLAFGAFDFGLDADGRWWFYECNPNGQWAWFPDPITDQIASAIADQLHNPPGAAT